MTPKFEFKERWLEIVNAIDENILVRAIVGARDGSQRIACSSQWLIPALFRRRFSMWSCLGGVGFGDTKPGLALSAEVNGTARLYLAASTEREGDV